MPKTGIMSSLGTLQQLLPLQETKARIEAQLKRSAEWAFLVMAGASFLGVALGHAFDLTAVRQAGGGTHPRVFAALLTGLVALGAWWLSSRRHTTWAIVWFASALYVLTTGMAIWLGTGVASAGSAVPVALVVIVGFLTGARAGLMATCIACLGSMGMLWLERSGLIAGLSPGNQPPATTYALVQTTVFAIIGLTVTAFSTMFWNAMRALDETRLALAEKVQAQMTIQQSLIDTQQQLRKDIAARLQAEQALIEHQEHLEEQVRIRTAQAIDQQRRLAGIIDALPVILAIKDAQGHHLLSNHLFEEYMGRSKAELLGCNIEALHDADMAQQIRQEDQALLSGAPMVRYEHSRPLPDGQSCDMLITKVALRDDLGQPETVLTLGVDISDIKSLQRALNAAKTEAERLTRVMSEFLANMSHEIRTPLHGVLGLAYMGLGQEQLNPAARQTFEKITASGKHLQGIIDDILDFSKIDAGKMELSDCALNPHQLVAEVMAMLEGRARGKGLILTHQLDLDEGAILGDPLRLRQILINLLSNAIKFTAQGRVALHAHIQARDTWVLEVQDTGIGMDGGSLERIFSPFEQADGSTSRRFGGSGLGLSISRQLARLMGGDIQVKSVLGQGSTFTVSLPWRQATEATLPWPTDDSPLASALPKSHDSLAGLRVLAVDDVEINLDIVQGLLSHAGATLTLCSSGKQALLDVKAQAKGWFDVVLMDVQMPVMNGMQATELLHMLDPELPVIAVTAHAKPEERQQFLDVGMVGYLAKPFEPDALIQTILTHARKAPTPTQTNGASRPTAAMSNLPDLALQDIDIEGALRRCAGKEALLRRLMARYSAEHQGFVAHCRGLALVDFEAARQHAHMFKGISANLGMGLLADLADQLEEAFVQKDEAASQAALHEMDSLLPRHLQALQQWLTPESSPA